MIESQSYCTFRQQLYRPRRKIIPEQLVRMWCRVTDSKPDLCPAVLDSRWGNEMGLSTWVLMVSMFYNKSIGEHLERKTVVYIHANLDWIVLQDKQTGHWVIRNLKSNEVFIVSSGIIQRNIETTVRLSFLLFPWTYWHSSQQETQRTQRWATMCTNKGFHRHPKKTIYYNSRMKMTTDKIVVILATIEKKLTR